MLLLRISLKSCTCTACSADSCRTGLCCDQSRSEYELLYLSCMAKHMQVLWVAHICPLPDQNPIILILDEWRTTLGLGIHPKFILSNLIT